MSRIGICTEPANGGFEAYIPELDLPRPFGWTRRQAEAALMPALRDFVYGRRAAGGPLPDLPDYAPPFAGAEIEYYDI